MSKPNAQGKQGKSQPSLTPFQELVRDYTKLKVVLPSPLGKSASQDDIDKHSDECKKEVGRAKRALDRCLTRACWALSPGKISEDELGRLFDLALANPVPGLKRSDSLKAIKDAVQQVDGVDHWLSRLTFVKQQLRPSLSNLTLILGNDPVAANEVRFNDLAQEVEFTGQLPALAGLTVPRGLFQDEHIPYIEAWLGAEWRMTPPAEGKIHKAVMAVAKDHRYSPVREYLVGLVWDGKVRIKKLVDALGVK